MTLTIDPWLMSLNAESLKQENNNSWLPGLFSRMKDAHDYYGLRGHYSIRAPTGRMGDPFQTPNCTTHPKPHQTTYRQASYSMDLISPYRFVSRIKLYEAGWGIHQWDGGGPPECTNCPKTINRSESQLSFWLAGWFVYFYLALTRKEGSKQS